MSWTGVSNTVFQWACESGHTDIANFLLENSIKMKIELNTKTECGLTAFQLACKNGHSRIAELLIQNSSKLHIQLNTKNNCGAILAKKNNHLEVVEIIIKTIIEMKTNQVVAWNFTAIFLWACKNGLFKIVEVLVKNSDQLNIELNAKGFIF